jgi:hypothetical protein
MEMAKRKQVNMHACFVDLSKAYDCVDRHLAWEILRARGAPRKLVDLIEDLHTDTAYALQSDVRQPQYNA